MFTFEEKKHDCFEEFYRVFRDQCTTFKPPMLLPKLHTCMHVCRSSGLKGQSYGLWKNFRFGFHPRFLSLRHSSTVVDRKLHSAALDSKFYVEFFHVLDNLSRCTGGAVQAQIFEKTCSKMIDFFHFFKKSRIFFLFPNILFLLIFLDEKSLSFSMA